MPLFSSSHRAVLRTLLFLPLALLFLGASTPTSAATPPGTAVLTYHNDLMRTGQNRTETVLNTTNVASDSFGKIASFPVDGQIYAQPLYVPQVAVSAKVKRDMVYVATEHDSVYGFDANSSQTTPPVWFRSFINPAAGITTIPTDDVYIQQSKDIKPEIGITGTPVIDPATKTLYVVVRTKENGAYFQRLHALDLATGADRPNSPVTITAAVPSNGWDSVNGTLAFDSKIHNQRGGLLLFNGVVYITWAAHADNFNFHGWIMGYNATSLQQVTVFLTTPENGFGGIWHSGGAPSVDASGNIYVATGNGTYSLSTGGRDAGNSLLKLRPNTSGSLDIVDYFTPFNQACLDGRDADFGSGNPLLLPDQTGTFTHQVVSVGKEGRVYVLNRDALGQFVTVDNPCDPATQQELSHDRVVQEFISGGVGLYGPLAYWSGPNNTQYVYLSSFRDYLKAYSITNGMLGNTAASHTADAFNFPGAIPSVSSNGSTAGTGIVWAVTPPPNCFDVGCHPLGAAIVRAYDATDLSRQLFSSETNPVRDRAGEYVKFSVPAIADGKVFVPTQNSLDIYGLIPAPTLTVNSKPAAGDPLLPGDTITVRLTATNPHPTPLTNASLSATLPDDLVYLEGSARSDGGTGFVPAYDPATRQVSITGASFAASGTQSLVFTAHVKTAHPATPPTQAHSVQIGVALTNDQSYNPTYSYALTIADSRATSPSALAFAVVLGVQPDVTVATGGQTTLSLTLYNGAVTAFTNAQVAVSLPSSLKVNPTTVAVTGAGTSFTLSPTKGSPKTVLISVASVPSGASTISVSFTNTAKAPKRPSAISFVARVGLSPKDNPGLSRAVTINSNTQKLFLATYASRRSDNGDTQSLTATPATFKGSTKSVMVRGQGFVPSEALDVYRVAADGTISRIVPARPPIASKSGSVAITLSPAEIGQPGSYGLMIVGTTSGIVGSVHIVGTP